MRNLLTLSMSLILSTGAAMAAEEVASASVPSAPVAPVVQVDPQAGRPEIKNPNDKVASESEKPADAAKAAPVPAPIEPAK